MTDLDYVFVPYRSKNEIVSDILHVLKKIPASKLQHSLNSKCLRVFITKGEITVQVEVKVAKEIKTEAISTHLFSPLYDLPKRLIPVVDHSVSMANKLAAWNERRLVRDLYDIWFFLRMNIRPDEEVLLRRLKRPVYSRLVKENDYFRGQDLEQFYEFFREQVSLLNPEEVETQMLSSMSPDEATGILSIFRAEFVKLGHS